ncbi:MAG: ABC transporter ATP-binding protein [Anaerolineales bacterium]|nr:ABC transporter ATP-binding protein [Anaerolineales bacterium]MCX7608429.1 ABC transporter ATP-binding protein [Anaerolineales bacterium]MDW8226759.1 ABC transporter ATP-binding protein [Anaerolineales bacterium]
MLEVRNLDSFYGELQVLRQVSLHVDAGEVVALFGPNGHGKSTLLKAISGLHPPTAGSVKFQGEEIAKLPAHKIVERGLVYIPEERHLFPDMTVMENLLLGAYPPRARKRVKSNLEFVFHIFPKLEMRQKQLCSTLSGGEARMVAIARGLMSETGLLLVDEPSIGLSPGMRKAVFEAIAAINRERGITILIVEQEIENALALSNRFYLLKKGQIAFERPTDQVDIAEIEKAYF